MPLCLVFDIFPLLNCSCNGKGAIVFHFFSLFHFSPDSISLPVNFFVFGMRKWGNSWQKVLTREAVLFTAVLSGDWGSNATKYVSIDSDTPDQFGLMSEILAFSWPVRAQHFSRISLVSRSAKAFNFKSVCLYNVKLLFSKKPYSIRMAVCTHTHKTPNHETTLVCHRLHNFT